MPSKSTVTVSSDYLFTIGLVFPSSILRFLLFLFFMNSPRALLGHLETFRGRFAGLFLYDWYSIPLLYAQVSFNFLARNPSLLTNSYLPTRPIHTNHDGRGGPVEERGCRGGGLGRASELGPELYFSLFGPNPTPLQHCNDAFLAMEMMRDYLL